MQVISYIEYQIDSLGNPMERTSNLTVTRIIGEAMEESV